MGKKDKKEVTLDDIEALDDQEKSEEFDDSFIEELGPVLSEKEKANNLKIIEDELKDLAEGSNIPGDLEGEVEKIFTFEEEEVPVWAKFPEASIKASIKAGEILPELRPRKNAIYRAILNSLPKEVISDKGNFYTVEIEIEGMRKSLKANRSFNFALTRFKTENKIPFTDLIGREIVFQKDENGYMIVQIK
ncbi:hypothetical protein ES702_05532 [subsurface metagenome]